MNQSNEWQQSEMKVFWGEMAPFNHVLQVYEGDEVFMNSLEGFVISGFENDNSVIVIATDIHMRNLERKLIAKGYDLTHLIDTYQYIPLNAEETLSKFMRTGWPDEKLFIEVITDLITHAKAQGREVRAFGEMVALLWAQGYSGATVQLEHLWNKVCKKESLCLFCAYPKSGFTSDADESLSHICSAHSKMLQGSIKTYRHVFYKTIDL